MVERVFLTEKRRKILAGESDAGSSGVVGESSDAGVSGEGGPSVSAIESPAASDCAGAPPSVSVTGSDGGGSETGGVPAGRR